MFSCLCKGTKGTQCTCQDFAFSESVAELAKSSTSGLSRAERHRFERRTPLNYLQYHLPCTVRVRCLIVTITLPNMPFAQGDEQNKERKDSHLTKNKNDGLGLK